MNFLCSKFKCGQSASEKNVLVESIFERDGYIPQGQSFVEKQLVLFAYVFFSAGRVGNDPAQYSPAPVSPRGTSVVIIRVASETVSYYVLRPLVLGKFCFSVLLFKIKDFFLLNFIVKKNVL